MKKDQSIALFNQKTVRRQWDGNKELWYFSIIDVIEVLTDSTIPRRYWTDLKSKLQGECSEVYEKIVQLKMVSPDGKIADDARQKLEKETGRKVVSGNNYLPKAQQKKQLS